MNVPVKSFKQALVTLINDIDNNRCLALSVRAAVLGLRLQDVNTLMPCIHSRDSKSTRQNLLLLLDSAVDLIVIASEDGKETRLNCGSDGEHAIEVLKYFKLHNNCARIEIQ
ncbi:hypothetical protein ACSPAH_23030 [Buttiauxella agrestis]